ncbi:hypothetical protein, partial [Shewanella algae]|uniref:hypothetical protein n=1 Tax=Shewanella algae TaxID=38313 RepID=UPI001C915597
MDTLSIEENLQVDEKLLFLINRAGANTATRLIRSNRTVAIKPIADISVAKDHIGLLYVNGRFIRRLEKWTPTVGHISSFLKWLTQLMLR